MHLSKPFQGSKSTITMRPVSIESTLSLFFFIQNLPEKNNTFFIKINILLEIHPASPGETNLFGILKFFILKLLNIMKTKSCNQMTKKVDFTKLCHCQFTAT